MDFSVVVVVFFTDIHVTQRINSSDYDNPLTFLQVPPAGFDFWFYVS